MNLAWVQQADPISSFQKRVVEVLSITRSGFQPDDDLLRSDLEWPHMGKEPLKACCIVAELTGFDHLTFLHRQATHHTRLHANIDTYRIRQCGWGRYRRGRFRHCFCPPSSHTNVRVFQLPQRANRPIRTSEHSSWIGSLVSSRHKLQQASSSLSILMDGELSVVGGHSLCREAIRCNLGSPVVSISLAYPFRLGERSAIYQILYELHLCEGRRSYQRGTTWFLSAGSRRIARERPPAPDGRSSGIPSRPVTVCSGVDG